MTQKKSFIHLLRCPISQQPLHTALQEELEKINTLLKTPLTAALIRKDRQIAYPVREGIPVLLEEEGVVVAEKSF